MSEPIADFRQQLQAGNTLVLMPIARLDVSERVEGPNGV